MNIPSNLYSNDPEALRIIPLGGCGDFGMNLTAYLFKNRLYVVDCGVMFPDSTKLGIDALVPKVDDWFKSLGGVYAYIITHGHEDHIGGLPHIIKKWPAPIYATPWTAELIQNKFGRRGMDREKHYVQVVEPGDKTIDENLEIEWFQVNHSIPQACALMIRAGRHKVFHSGDFKYDQTPVGEAPMDLKRLRKYGDEGIDLLLTDSTNANKSGLGPSENSVTSPLEELIRGANGISFLTTFSSNFWRIKTTLEICERLGKKVYIAGYSFETTLAIAASLNMIKSTSHLLLSEDQAKQIERKDLVVLISGCQGEWRSALGRVAAGESRLFKIKDGDQVIFSSRIIPGNERTVQSLISRLQKAGAKVITAREKPEIHVSGHAYGGEIELFLNNLRPKHYIPIHGTFAHLIANAAVADKVAEEDKVIIENGDVIELSNRGVRVVDHIDVDIEFIDGESDVPLSWEVLRERLRIGELGAAIVSGIYLKGDKRWLRGPDVLFQGLELPSNVDYTLWRVEVTKAVDDAIAAAIRISQTAEAELREEVRLSVRRELTNKLKKKPIVIPQVYFLE